LLAGVRFAFGVAILLYLWKAGAIDFRDFDKLLTQWPLSLAAIAVLFLDIYLMAVRTRMLLRPQGLHLSIGTAVRLTLVSSWFAMFSPGAAGGDIAKIFYATRQAAGRRAEIAVVLLFDRAIGLFSLFLIPVLLAPFLLTATQGAPQLRQLLAVTAAIAAITLLAFILAIFNDPIRNLFLRRNLRPDSKQGWLLRATLTLSAYRNHIRTLLLSLVLAIVDNCLVIVITSLALEILNPAALSAKLALVVPLGTIANSLPLTPGGLGVGEAAFNKVFALAGLSLGAEALVCSRIWRAITAIPGLLIYLRGVDPVALHSSDAPPDRHV
jgi:glycosyltransferase 2 family protein